MKIMIKIMFLYLLLMVLLSTGNVKANDENEISSKEAINIASLIATENNYNIHEKDVEILKVYKDEERGPIRLSWLIRYFPMEQRDIFFNNKFWIVYFYPKNGLDDPRQLGGEFCVIVELFSGKVLASFKVQ